MNIVIRVNEETKNKMLEYYKDKIKEKTPPYAIFQAVNDDTTITMYQSLKVMFQGVSADVDANIWKEVNSNSSKTKKKVDDKYLYCTSIGSDEVGTGDYFGPIVVTASYVRKDQIDDLKKLKVGDSKKFDDEQILKIVPKFIKDIKYKSIILSNEEYNQKYNKDTNMNKIKAIMHNKVLYSLYNEVEEKPQYVVVDQFAKEDRYYEYIKESDNVLKNITFMIKAEDKNMAVATASMISRYLFLKEMDKLSDFYHVPIPKGAGANVDTVGEELVEKYGKDVLDKIAKKNFANTQKILKTMIF